MDGSSVNVLWAAALAGLTALSSLAAGEDVLGQLGPWRQGDIALSQSAADDRPNDEAWRIIREHFTPTASDIFALGEKGAFGAMVFPRNDRWAGIVITTPDRKPVALTQRFNAAPYRIAIVNPDSDPKTLETVAFVLYDSKALYSDASRCFRPRTEIQVFRRDAKGEQLLDTIRVDFTKAVLPDSGINMAAFNDADTTAAGFVLPKGSDFVRADGRRMFFWGGHENHIPSKAQADLYAESYRAAGINVMRHLGHEEMVKDPETGEIDRELMDDFFYLVHRLGSNGIYFMMSHTHGYVGQHKKYGKGGACMYGYPRGQVPAIDHGLLIFTDPKVRAVQKKFWKELLTTVSPYTGKALKDDPTVIGFELANETGLNPRYFDYNRLDAAGKASSDRWRELFNQYLIRKYGDLKSGKLKDAWAQEQLFRWEDPAQNVIPIPWRFRGERVWGGAGQHDHFTTGKLYLDGTTRTASPRISDAIEFTYEVQKTWADDFYAFLRNEVGMKVALGWDGDCFQICEIPNHKANMDSRADVTIAPGYCDWDNGDQINSRTKNVKRWSSYSYIHNRPTFAYEWGAWTTMGPFVYEYILHAALFGRVYGFDGFAHHKMAAMIYPAADPDYSVQVHYITPISDRPRRGAFSVARWILSRSRVEEVRDRLLIGYPRDSAFTGGPERKFSHPAFENWLMYQIGTEDYSFEQVYDGPTDRIVIHEGRGPYGDYRKAAHAILWCHSNTDREGKDAQAKEKWFAMHGIKFAPGQKYFVNDQYFATTEDMSEYIRVHEKAEKARWEQLNESARKNKAQAAAAGAAPTSALARTATAAADYWAAEPDAQPSELDCQVYRALKRWGYPLPFAEDEIDKVWRSRDRTIEMDTRTARLTADRPDMLLWCGKPPADGNVQLGKLSARTTERQYDVALLPWDTADFGSAGTLALWCMWNSEVTIKHSFKTTPKVYAVNWLGKRIFSVKPLRAGADSVTIATARHNDVFCYEITR